MHTPEICEFTKADWNCYSGAERFRDGKEPLIVNIPASNPNQGTEITVLADRSGIICMTDYGSFAYTTLGDPRWNQDIAYCIILYLLKQKGWIDGDESMIAAQCVLDDKWVTVL